MDATLRSYVQQLGTNLLGNTAQQAGYASGQAAGLDAARALLSQILGSGFAQQGTPASSNPISVPPAQGCCPSPIDRFGGQLRELGILVRAIGQVLRALAELIKNRTQWPSPGGTNGGGTTGGTNGGGTTGGTNGGGTTGGTTGGNGTIGDKVAEAESQYLPKMSDEQRAMYELQKQVNRQSEASSLMASLMKADHDARQAILQKIG